MYYQVDRTEVGPLIYERGSSRSKWKSRKSCIAIVLVVLVVVLVLGLGLGLGLRRGSSTTVEDTCRDFNQAQFAQSATSRSKGEAWLKRDCSMGDKPECPAGYSKPPLLLISMDGFRADYMKRNLTPVLEKIANCGVKTSHMRPAFPTKTFPNHYSIVTGLYPESHGIIDNKMVDLEMNQLFRLSSDTRFDPRWWHGEPIWVSARKAGKKAATMFWPGSEIKIGGYYPNRCFWYDKSVPFDMRVDRVLQWLDEPEGQRPDIITLYFHQPDSAGHDQGPFGEQVNGNLTAMDELLGHFMDQLIERKLDKCIDMIIVADHGMTSNKCGNVADIRPSLKNEKVFVWDGTMARVTSQYIQDGNSFVPNPNPVPADDLVKKLECSSYDSKVDYNTKVYKKTDLPVRNHYVQSPRIEEVIMTARDEWLIKGGLLSYCSGGNHGYDNIFHSMQALFMAYGSSFKRIDIEPFENIEIYNLLTDMLNIPHASNNGTDGRLHRILRHPPASPTNAPPGSEYKSTKFPDDSGDRQKRREMSDCNCTHASGQVDTSDLRLNLSQSDIRDAEKTYLGENTPVLDQMGLDVFKLVQSDYITAYSRNHKMPLWAAFNLDGQAGGDLSNVDAECSRVDVRFSPDENTPCSAYNAPNISRSFLVPPGVAPAANQADTQISTNLVPMYDSFRSGIWTHVLKLLEEYKTKYSKINVLLGPVFDDNHDGLPDSKLNSFVPGSSVPLPTHFFVHLTRCETASTDATACSEDKLNVMAIIVPHKPDPGNCWDVEEDSPFRYLQTHVARPRDVELITGLRLLWGISSTDHQTELRTHLAIDLWPRVSWLDEQECPVLQADKCNQRNGDLPVLLISLDGFRPDYLERGVSPVLEKIGRCGVSTPYMQSIYPTVTFPNHYSIVTGMYPESHGIVGNSMFDVTLNKTFSLGSPNTFDSRWWGGDPIWNKVQQFNKTSGIYFWPGSDVEINGSRPSQYFKFNGDVPYSKRVDTVVGWLTGRNGWTPDLAAFYIEKVDKAGHDGGPNSLQVTEAVQSVDGYLKQLMDGLKRHGVDKCVNILVTSDHGMSEIACERDVLLQDNGISYEWQQKMRIYRGPVGRLATTYDKKYRPLPESERIPTEDIVHSTSCRSKNMDVFTKDSLPRRLHFTDNQRIGEVQLVMNDRWTVNIYKPWCGMAANHGWDATFDSMKALFQGYGPSFKSKYVAEPFENIELYNLMSDLMSIPISPNNGTVGTLYHIMATQPSPPSPGGSKTYTQSAYPKTDADYEERANALNCSCWTPAEKDVKYYDECLNLTDAQREQVMQQHLPHGQPTHSESELFLLSQQDYISAYSKEYRMPLWSAFTLSTEVTNITAANCLRPDVRLDPTAQPDCSDFQTTEYIGNHLFPPALASNNDSAYDSYLLTNVVPMLPDFATGVWRYLISMLQELSASSGPLHIINGPVFDYNNDGRKDDISKINTTVNGIPVPSHFFVVILRCPENSTNSCSDMNYETQAFVVEHRRNVTNCMTFEEYTFDHRTRLRDIELLTEFQLLTKTNSYEALHARTTIARRPGFASSANLRSSNQ